MAHVADEVIVISDDSNDSMPAIEVASLFDIFDDADAVPAVAGAGVIEIVDDADAVRPASVDGVIEIVDDADAAGVAAPNVPTVRREPSPALIHHYLERIFHPPNVVGMVESLPDENGGFVHKVPDYVVARFSERTTIHETFKNDPSDLVGIDDFKVLKCLGSGACAKIYLVRKLGGIDNDKLYAMKVIPKLIALKTNISIEHTKVERKTLEAVRGKPFLSQMHYAFQTKADLFIIMDYVGGGDLFMHLSNCTEFTLDQIRYYVAEIVVALDTLHRFNVVHRDIKLENILMDMAGNLVISDFGAAVNVHTPSAHAISVCGSIEYMAPEMFRIGRRYNSSSDWWALGVLIYEFMSGASPFTICESANSRNEVVTRIMHSDKPDLPNLDEDVKNIINGLLTFKPRHRLGCGAGGVGEIKAHRFLSNINWDALKEKRLRAPLIPTTANETDTRNFSTEYTTLPTSTIHAHRVNNAEAFFIGYEFVAPHVVEANKYYRKLNRKDGQKIEHPIIPKDFFAVPLTIDAVEFRTDNSTFFQKYKLCGDKQIYTGAYSMFYVCENILTGVSYGCKILNTMPATENEVEKLVKCQGHPNVIKLIDCIVESRYTYIVMELLNGGNLLDRLATTLLLEHEIFTITDQMVRIMEFIHSKNVAHCDVNLRNFMFTSPSSLNIKLIDFGSAIYVDNDASPPVKENFLKPTFKIECTAPEIIQFYDRQLIINATVNRMPVNQFECVKESDIWSIGIIFYYLFCNEYPFFSKPYSYEIIKAQIFAGEIKKNVYSDKVKFFTEIDEDAKTLIAQLINVNPLARFSVAQIRLNKWYKKHRRIASSKRSVDSEPGDQPSSKLNRRKD